jgi:hypothetical protein
MRNLDIADTREKLIVHSKARLLSAGEGTARLRLGEQTGWWM